VESSLAITIFGLLARSSAAFSHLGARVLQWPHHLLNEDFIFLKNFLELIVLRCVKLDQDIFIIVNDFIFPVFADEDLDWAIVFLWDFFCLFFFLNKKHYNI
jgi:hypothetical protein